MSEEKPKLVNEPGNENPWYVMMTIAGEQRQPVVDKALHAKNRRYWNGWAAQKLSKGKKNKLIAEGRETAEDLAPLTDKEQKEIDFIAKERLHSNEKFPPEGTEGKDIDFSNNEFPNLFSCSGFIFPYALDFSGATFLGLALFNKAIFSEKANFNGATFSGVVNFNNATFSEWAGFDKATFSGLLFFKEATFSGVAEFGEAIFKYEAKFQDSKFKYTTKFNNAKFNGMPPEFYNATLHEDTDWTDIKWPKAPQGRKQAIEYRRAYERLKLIMAQQNKFPDEHSFLREELRCREVEKVVSLATLFSYFYRWFSDYGRSIGRPFIALLVVWVIGFLFIYGIEFSACKSIDIGQSMEISAYNTFNTFPFFHDTYFPKDISLSRSSIVVSVLQTVFGLVFLFLLGLGLRNRFRIK